MYYFKNLTDDELIALIRQNDETAIAALLNRYKNKFYTAAVLLVKDRTLAEDLFQDACVKIIQSIRMGKYKDDGRFMAWAMRLTRNLCYDYLRAAKRAPKIMTQDGQDVFEVLHFKSESAESVMIQYQSEQNVKKMLDALPDEQREVVVLRVYGGLSFKEIATLTDTSINTCLGRMRYALINLRKMMHEKQISL